QPGDQMHSGHCVPLVLARLTNSRPTSNRAVVPTALAALRQTRALAGVSSVTDPTAIGLLAHRMACPCDDQRRPKRPCVSVAHGVPSGASDFDSGWCVYMRNTCPNV